MKTRWLFRLVALLAAFSLVAAACGDDDDDDITTDPTDGTTEPADDGVEEPADDGVDDGDDGFDDGVDDTAMDAACDATVPGTRVDYAIYAPSRALDPPHSSGALVGGTELAAIYDVLMRFNPETGEFDPHLAVGMESNDDFTVWTLELRDGITYDDGTPLDADMVLANIERYFPEEGRVLNTSPAFLAFIESSEKIDDLTIEFTLNQPWANFPFVFNDEPGMVVNINAIGDDVEAFGANPPAEAGVGPYIVQRNVSGEELVMTARQNYWNGPVCIETLRFDLATAGAIVGMETAYGAFRSGDVNAAFLRNESVIAQAEADGAKLDLAWQDGGAKFIINMREDAPLSDPVLREAVALAIDTEIINERAYGGDLTHGKAIILEGSPFYTDEIEQIPTDTARAEELVAEAGFTGTLRILCPSGPEATESSLAAQAMLGAIGIESTVENLPTTDQIGKLVTGDYDLGCWGINAGPDTAVTSMVRNYLSTSPSNRQGLADPELDEAQLAALAAPQDELAERLAVVNNIYASNFYAVPFGALNEGLVMADNLMGVKQTGSTIFLFDAAYISD